MSNPFNFWATFNDGHCLPSDAHNQNLISNLRIQQYVRNIEAALIQNEQEKRTILAWNTHLEQENDALRQENSQMKQWLKDMERANKKHVEKEEKAKETPSRREMNSEELIDSLIGHTAGDQCQHVAANGTAKPLGRETDEQRSAGSDKLFGKKIEQLIAEILDNHASIRRKKPRQLAAEAQLAEHRGRDCADTGAQSADDIEYLGYGFSTSTSFAAENEFPPPPKTPPPPVTPPLSPPHNGRELEAAPPKDRLQKDVSCVPQQSQQNNSTTIITDVENDDYHHHHQNNVDVDDSAVDGVGVEVIFVDDVCRNKWRPSMMKREQTIGWDEIVLDEDESGGTLEGAENASPLPIAGRQSVNFKMET